MKISELFNEFMQSYDEETKNSLWEKQRDDFFSLWDKSLLEKLQKSEIDKIVKLLDKHGKGSTSDDEAVAHVMVPQGAWYRIFSDFLEQPELRKKCNLILTLNDDNSLIKLIDDVFLLNNSNKNHFTGSSGSAINSLLALKNPFVNLSIVSLNHRYKILQFLNIYPDDLKKKSIGTQIIETNQLIMRYFVNNNISENARTITSFFYSDSISKLWKIKEKSISELPIFLNQDYFLILKEEIEYINSKSKDNWAITQKGKNNIRIHFGNFIVFSTSEKSLWLPLKNVNSEYLNNVSFWNWDIKDYPNYKKNGLISKNGNFYGNIEEWNKIKPLHFNFIDEIASRAYCLNIKTKKNNRSEILIKLIDKTGIDLSLPSYETTEDNFNEVITELNLIDTSHFGSTEKEALIKVRKGQYIFRENLLRRDQECLICGLKIQQILRASHIKPWSEFLPEDKERLDVDNGILLCANHDLLFDRFLITFTDDGSLLYSNIIENLLNKLDIDINKKIKLSSDKQRKFMNWHRDEFKKRTIEQNNWNNTKL
jgi:hypothetical protein